MANINLESQLSNNLCKLCAEKSYKLNYMTNFRQLCLLSHKAGTVIEREREGEREGRSAAAGIEKAISSVHLFHGTQCV